MLSSVRDLGAENGSHVLILTLSDEAKRIGKLFKESIDFPWPIGVTSFLLNKGFLRWKETLEPFLLQISSGVTQGAKLQPSDDLTH